MSSELAEERKLIFINLLNNVPVENVAQAFHRDSVAAVMDDFKFVALKIKSYMFARAMPFIPLDTVAEAMQNKFQVLDILAKVNLDVLPEFTKVSANKLEDVYL